MVDVASGGGEGSVNYKKCYESVKKYSEEIGFKLVELNETNLREYIEFPDEIWKLWEKGCIMPAHFLICAEYTFYLLK